VSKVRAAKKEEEKSEDATADPQGPVEDKEERLRKEARAVRALQAEMLRTTVKVLCEQNEVDRRRKAL
jgi:hypothetical protein